MTNSFKKWFYKEDYDTDLYEPPDEVVMQRILKNPKRVEHFQDVHGETFIFKFPLSIEKIKFKTGSRIGINAPIGSLTAACFRYLKSKNYKELYELLVKIKNNSDKKISNQILFHINENAR